MIIVLLMKVCLIFRSSMSEVQKKDKVAAQKEGKTHIYSKD